VSFNSNVLTIFIHQLSSRKTEHHKNSLNLKT